MKAAACFLAVVVIAAVSVEAFQNQSRIIGNVRAGDRMLDREVAYKPGRRNTVVVYNYKYPKFGSNAIISCVKVLDQWYNGTNAEMFINSGGVGSRSINFSLRSHQGFGIQYNIEVYGR